MERKVHIMPWQISIITDYPVVETLFSGFLTEEELKPAMEETLAIAKNHAINLFLEDCTQMDGVQSVAVLFFLSGSLKLKSVIFHSKKAVLIRNICFTLEQIRFWEAKCLERDIEIRLFSDRQLALDWLLSGTFH